MAKNIILSKLENIGLSKKEASVYLACLKNNIAPVSHIAKSAKLNRVTTYGILEKLFQRGVVEIIEKAGIKHFSAIPPEILAETAKQKAEDFEEALPMLKAMVGNSAFRPTVRFFEGMEGVQQAYFETLKSKTEILSYANSQNIRVHWSTYDEDYVRLRKEHGIFLRGLAPDDKAGKMVKTDDKKYYREMRLLPRKNFSTEHLENEINIYDERMMIASFEPHAFAIIIKSTAVYETQKEIFEMMWRFSEKL